MDVKEVLRDALDEWINGDIYTQATQIGQRIDSLMKHVPSKLKVSPSNTLYRAVAISKSLFLKIRTGRKDAFFEKSKIQ